MNQSAEDQFQRVCAIEDQAGRAMRAVGQFGDVELRGNLARAEWILAEVRNAARYLVDPDVDPQVRQQVIDGLVEVIQNI